MAILVSTHGGRLSMTIDLGYGKPVDQTPSVITHGMSFSVASKLLADLATAIGHAAYGDSWAAEPQTRHRPLLVPPKPETAAGGTPPAI